MRSNSNAKTNSKEKNAREKKPHEFLEPPKINPMKGVIFDQPKKNDIISRHMDKFTCTKLNMEKIK